jgi:hypothetical protein
MTPAYFRDHRADPRALAHHQDALWVLLQIQAAPVTGLLAPLVESWSPTRGILLNMIEAPFIESWHHEQAMAEHVAQLDAILQEWGRQVDAAATAPVSPIGSAKVSAGSMSLTKTPGILCDMHTDREEFTEPAVRRRRTWMDFRRATTASHLSAARCPSPSVFPVLRRGILTLPHLLRQERTLASLGPRFAKGGERRVIGSILFVDGAEPKSAEVNLTLFRDVMCIWRAWGRAPSYWVTDL